MLGNALRPASRQQLADWLIDNETGDACLRAGLGKRWRVGDKTGSNGEDARNDIAVLWPVQGGSPWVLTAYLQAGTISFEQRAAVLAQVGRIADGLIR
ncbi:Beta-lactamase Toho-1 precursor [compost metagenome]